jgi:MOSC domain-containing protein YiiM
VDPIPIPDPESLMGTIIQVNISPGGMPKRPVALGVLTPLGLEGDGHDHPQVHGGPDKAVLVIAAEVVDELKARGYPVFYGALGENFTTRGLDVRDLRIGDTLRAGGCMLEITKVRGPCSQLDVYGPAIKSEIYDRAVKNLDPTSPRWGWSGFYCAVRSGGPVGPGDPIEVVAQTA